MEVQLVHRTIRPEARGGAYRRELRGIRNAPLSRSRFCASRVSCAILTQIADRCITAG